MGHGGIAQGTSLIPDLTEEADGQRTSTLLVCGNSFWHVAEFARIQDRGRL